MWLFMNNNKQYPVSWEQLHRDARALAWRLIDYKFDTIIAITRGGMVPAGIIARELGIFNIETLCINSYDHQQQGDLKIIKDVSEHIKQNDNHILVVDDLVDTGKTVDIIKNLLPKAHIATLYAKPMAKDKVDSFITELSQDTWVFFPWDMELQYVMPIKKDAIS
jgi:xanthine phosphoribosyltransferase